MTHRIPFSEMEWRGKPVADLGRSELLELVEILYGLTCESAGNFDRLHSFHNAAMHGREGRV